MKKKKSIYILLPLVILVWGAIIAKVLFNFSDSDAVNTTTKAIHAPDKTQKNVIDSFSLYLNYADPFLGKMSNSNNSTNSQTQSFQNIKEGIVKKPQQWPNIKYYGLVKNSKTRALKANISVNNKMFILKEKEKIENLRLEMISIDSVIFSLKYEHKTFFKNQ